MTHPRGVTLKVAFKSCVDHGYTGIFKGAKNGIMRFSETTRTDPSKAMTAPGFGLKFLRDGMDSANTVPMVSLDGQPSFNYFKNRYQNHPGELENECARETLGKKLAEVSDHIGNMSVKHWCTHDEDGLVEETPKCPFALDFEPFDIYGWTDEYQADF